MAKTVDAIVPLYCGPEATNVEWDLFMDMAAMLKF